MEREAIPRARRDAAYVAAVHAAVGSSVRHLLALEAVDKDVGAILVGCTRDGEVVVTLLNWEGTPIMEATV